MSILRANGNKFAKSVSRSNCNWSYSYRRLEKQKAFSDVIFRFDFSGELCMHIENRTRLKRDLRKKLSQDDSIVYLYWIPSSFGGLPNERPIFLNNGLECYTKNRNFLFWIRAQVFCLRGKGKNRRAVGPERVQNYEMHLFVGNLLEELLKTLYSAFCIQGLLHMRYARFGVIAPDILFWAGVFSVILEEVRDFF